MKDFDIRYVFNPVRLTHQAYGLLPKEKKAVLVKKAPIITVARIQPRYVDSLALQLKPLSQSLTPFSSAAQKLADKEVPFPHTGETLMDRQKTTVAWMLKRERNPEPFVECEREEELIDGLQLRLLGDASRMIIRRGGIIADDIGFGKTVMVMALFSLQKQFDEDHHTMRKKTRPKGSTTTSLNCNLVICPPNIVHQWGGEIKKFLGSGNGHNFILVKTFAQLKQINPEDYRIIVLSGSIFAEKKYMEALASCVQETFPAAGITSIALNKWRDGRAYSDWHASMAKKVNLKDVKKKFILEQYSFNRIVWDEVSYDNPAVSSFVTNSHAVSKWLLSGTPPTGNLKEVCSLARTLGLHIARPLDLRLGLPRIAKGPSLSPRTSFEEIESYGMTKSSDFITERHQQAERFLSTFTACNKVDRTKHAFKVYEHVLVCPPTLSEASTYQALQAEVRSADMDEEDMTPEGAKRLRSATLKAKEGNDGESESIKGLVLTATLPSLVTSSYAERSPAPGESNPKHKGVLGVREGLMKEATFYVRHVFHKLIWLAVRLHRAIHKTGVPADQTQKDISEYDEITNSLSQILKDLDEGNVQTFKGRSNYVELAKAILSVEEEDIYARLYSKKTLLDATKDNSGPLHDAFATNDNNINLLYKRFNSKWPEFYLLDPEDVHGHLKILETSLETDKPSEKLIDKLPDDDVVNLILGLGLKGYSAKELEARAKTDNDRKALRGKLAEFVKDVMEKEV
ncbi:uncharacterized protein PG998_012409 [Apiospora kogelbergensis]|uniref:uncharacterized protein n=1 Tax=Apiospora kogelbergensis TaxID=1337665 RepID=UPI003130D9DF